MTSFKDAARIDKLSHRKRLIRTKPVDVDGIRVYEVMSHLQLRLYLMYDVFMTSSFKESCRLSVINISHWRFVSLEYSREVVS